MNDSNNQSNLDRNDRTQTFTREREKRKQRRKLWLEARYRSLYHFEIVTHLLIVLLLIALGVIAVGATSFVVMGDSTKAWSWAALGWTVTQSAIYFYFLRAFFHMGVDIAMKYLEPSALAFGEPADVSAGSE